MLCIPTGYKLHTHRHTQRQQQQHGDSVVTASPPRLLTGVMMVEVVLVAEGDCIIIVREARVVCIRQE